MGWGKFLKDPLWGSGIRLEPPVTLDDVLFQIYRKGSFRSRC